MIGMIIGMTISTIFFFGTLIPYLKGYFGDIAEIIIMFSLATFFGFLIVVILNLIFGWVQ